MSTNQYYWDVSGADMHISEDDWDDWDSYEDEHDIQLGCQSRSGGGGTGGKNRTKEEARCNSHHGIYSAKHVRRKESMIFTSKAREGGKTGPRSRK